MVFRFWNSYISVLKLWNSLNIYVSFLVSKPMCTNLETTKLFNYMLRFSGFETHVFEFWHSETIYIEYKTIILYVMVFRFRKQCLQVMELRNWSMHQGRNSTIQNEGFWGFLVGWAQIGEIVIFKSSLLIFESPSCFSITLVFAKVVKLPLAHFHNVFTSSLYCF